MRTWLFQQLAQGSGHRLQRYWSSRAGRQGRAGHLQDHLHTQKRPCVVIFQGVSRASVHPHWTDGRQPPVFHCVLLCSAAFCWSNFHLTPKQKVSSNQSLRDQNPISVNTDASLSLCALCHLPRDQCVVCARRCLLFSLFATALLLIGISYFAWESFQMFTLLEVSKHVRDGYYLHLTYTKLYVTNYVCFFHFY